MLVTTKPWVIRGKGVQLTRQVSTRLGVAIGAVGAIFPTGFYDREGAGILGGVVFAVVAAAVSAPILLAAAVLTEIGTDRDENVWRDVYCAGGSLAQTRVGALAAAAHSWLVVLAAAVISGALVGFGDGLINQEPMGHLQWSTVGIALGSQLYVAMLASSLALLVASRRTGFLLIAVNITILPVLAPLARGGWSEWLGLLPLAPLYSQLPGELLGLIELDIRDRTALLWATGWFVVGAISSLGGVYRRIGSN